MPKSTAKKEKVVHITRDKPTGETTASEPLPRLRTFEEMERMFEELMPHRLMRPSQWELPVMGEWMSAFERRMMPHVDIIDRDSELILRAQIPGVAKKDLSVSMTENRVTIEGETSSETTEEKDDYYRRECAHGSFSRTVALPCSVDSTKAKASFSNGMLEMSLPKLNKSTRHAVPIS